MILKRIGQKSVAKLLEPYPKNQIISRKNNTAVNLDPEYLKVLHADVIPE